MPTLLHLDSSADLSGARSRALTAAFTEAWSGPDHLVVYRDLHRDPPPHLRDPEQHWAPALRRPDSDIPMAAERAQQRILDDLLAADVLLIGAPTYNYSLPSTLKAWLDHVHVPGVTAPITSDHDTQTQPLAGRPAVIINTSGATYDPGSPTESWNHAVPPLQIVLGEAFGMRVDVISCTRTLADRVGDLADQSERAAAEFDQARRQAIELAVRLRAERA